VVQGSDYPFPLGEAVPGELVRQSDLTASVQTDIFEHSPAAWLGL
jgi:hypothetical protein